MVKLCQREYAKFVVCPLHAIEIMWT